MSKAARTAEREQLAQAIAARDAAAGREATLTQAVERARADAFLARRSVEDAERALNRARETARESLVDAYTFMGGDGSSDGSDAVIEAERILAVAQRRLADLQMVEKELATRTGPAPGRSIPNIKVDAAIRDVVRAHPTVRRLIADYDTARRAWEEYHSTLRWLAAHDCIPDELKGAAPKAHETYHAEPDPQWTAAIESLKRDADAELPT